ncbi:hypothetical protein BDC45DRAFT_562715 [Circinella umbellata]|nr:hypothetical protein BDC45DRAFT_562715 [Circinella umbellata]
MQFLYEKSSYWLLVHAKGISYSFVQQGMNIIDPFFFKIIVLIGNPAYFGAYQILLRLLVGGNNLPHTLITICSPELLTLEFYYRYTLLHLSLGRDFVNYCNTDKCYGNGYYVDALLTTLSMELFFFLDNTVFNMK